MCFSRSRQLLPGLAIATGCLFATPALSAAESGFQNGLWLAYQIMPEDFEVEVDVSGADSTDEEWETANRFALGYRGRGAGQTAFVISAGLAFTNQEWEDPDDGDETQVSSTGLVAEPGVSFRLHENFDLDLVARLGFTYTELGILVRPAYRFDGGFLLFAELGYLSHDQEYDIDFGFADIEYTVESSGVVFGAGAGFVF